MGERLESLKNNRIVKGAHFYSFGLLKRLYLWVLSFAESKYSTYALALLALAESSFFPIPPDVLQLSLSISKPKKSFWYAFVAGTFSVLGGILGYFIGFFLFESIGKAIIFSLGYEQAFNAVGMMYKENAFLAILGAAFTPIPYKVFTLAAGFWQVRLFDLIFASIIGRYGRFFIEALLTYFFGDKVKVIIEKYFNWISLGVFLLVVLGYFTIKYLI